MDTRYYWSPGWRVTDRNDPLSTPDSLDVNNGPEPAPYIWRVALIGTQVTLGAMISLKLLQVRFRYVRSLAFIPARAATTANVAKSAKQKARTTKGKSSPTPMPSGPTQIGPATPASILLQAAYHSTGMGHQFPIKDCVLQEVPGSQQLHIFVEGEMGSWVVDPAPGAYYDGIKGPRPAIIKAGIIEAWVALKKGEFTGPLSPEALELSVKRLAPVVPLTKLKARPPQ